jgi:hypothetical protein
MLVAVADLLITEVHLVQVAMAVEVREQLLLVQGVQGPQIPVVVVVGQRVDRGAQGARV